MIFRSLAILMLLNSVLVVGQTQKPDLYLFFKADSAKRMYKIPFNIGKGKPVIYDLVDETRRPIVNFAYVPIDVRKSYFVDSTFVKRRTRTLDQVKGDSNFLRDTRDREYPYRRVFIVEFISPNRFEVIQVDSYIGSEDILYP